MKWLSSRNASQVVFGNNQIIYLLSVRSVPYLSLKQTRITVDRAASPGTTALMTPNPVVLLLLALALKRTSNGKLNGACPTTKADSQPVDFAALRT